MTVPVRDVLLVAGSANLDFVVRASHVPAPGETVLGREFNTFPGGKGANQAVAAARLGAPVSFIARIGDDAIGHQMKTGFANDGIDVACADGILRIHEIQRDGGRRMAVRDWLNANPGNDYLLPQDVIDKTIAKYKEAYNMLTGKNFK